MITTAAPFPLHERRDRRHDDEGRHRRGRRWRQGRVVQGQRRQHHGADRGEALGPARNLPLANEKARPGIEAGLGCVDRLQPISLRLSFTSSTPFVLRAIEIALSRSAVLFTVPLSVTTPRIVSTLMSRAFTRLSAANAVLILALRAASETSCVVLRSCLVPAYVVAG